MVKTNSETFCAQSTRHCPLSFPPFLRWWQCKRKVSLSLAFANQDPPLALHLVRLWGILGKYYYDISLESRELLSLLTALVSSLTSFKKVFQYFHNGCGILTWRKKIPRALLKWPIQHNFPPLWEGSQPVSCSPGHPLVDLEGTFLELNQGSVY